MIYYSFDCRIFSILILGWLVQERDFLAFLRQFLWQWNGLIAVTAVWVNNQLTLDLLSKGSIDEYR